MKGKVEVFCVLSDGTEELLYEQANLVVDGAGESIVDMLTTPSSLLPVMPRLYDSSNWGIKGLSFGSAGRNFGLDPERPSTCCTFEDFGIDGAVCAVPANYVTSTLLEDPTFWTNADRSDPDNRIVRALWLPNNIENSDPSSYDPPYYMPSYPDPMDKRLEDASTAYSIVSGDGTQSYGHFENRIEFNRSDASAYTVGAYCIGDNPTVNDNFWVALVSSLDGDFVADRSLHIAASADLVGAANGYNGKSTVDYRGFVRVEPIAGAEDYYASWNSTTNNAQWAGRVWVSGVGTQTDPVDFVLDPRIMVTTKLNGDDLNMFNMYGGLHHVGLWSFDMKKCLANSNPPWGWDLDPTTGDNDREYRLFAKKTFTNNLCRIRDNGATAGLSAYTALLIRWTVDLRSDK